MSVVLDVGLEFDQINNPKFKSLHTHQKWYLFYSKDLQVDAYVVLLAVLIENQSCSAGITTSEVN